MFQICPGCMNSIPRYAPDVAGSLLTCPECDTARWLRSRSSSDETPPIKLFDTTEVSVEATVDAVRAWLDEPVSGVMVGG